MTKKDKNDFNYFLSQKLLPFPRNLCWKFFIFTPISWKSSSSFAFWWSEMISRIVECIYIAHNIPHRVPFILVDYSLVLILEIIPICVVKQIRDNTLAPFTIAVEFEGLNKTLKGWPFSDYFWCTDGLTLYTRKMVYCSF